MLVTQGRVAAQVKRTRGRGLDGGRVVHNKRIGGGVGDSQGWGLRSVETDGERHFTSSANLPVLDFKLGNGQIDKG